ncbi:hypothetical protein [Aliivibrio wodanis]|uniref:hypothetical protein n=1 Tax=Aliivibrio wodanis TaxID=80852 RepID=UPI00406CBC0B
MESVSVVNEKKIAERLKKAILERGGYEKISELTNLSVSTLKRCANGQTEPKFSTVAKISGATRKNIGFIAYGIGDEDSIISAGDESQLKSNIKELKDAHDAHLNIIDDLTRRLNEIEFKLTYVMYMSNDTLVGNKTIESLYKQTIKSK